ncbi:aldehyde dehydrogenase family protein [Yersinia canariae]|uniref:Aldehyde dehydrogenase family protein n=1 Tax=Yersinia canariae TaxID=2607663 RepID=A0A857F1H9_9GAMM|nr:aldehyde dehydrogenase family protein [Yersinia canariae]QHB33084.1 aldehyde dehydrogenase family protein [Yersinia canariae]
MSLNTSKYSSAEYSFAELLINGQWRNGQSNLLRVYNPYDQKLLTEISLASVVDVDSAFLAASKSQPDWARTLPSERAEVMRSAVRVMEQRHSEIVNWLIDETGSVRLKAEFEWSAVRSMLLEAASLPTQISGRILSGDILDKEHRIYFAGIVNFQAPRPSANIRPKRIEQAGGAE